MVLVASLYRFGTLKYRTIADMRFGMYSSHRETATTEDDVVGLGGWVGRDAVE